MKVIDDAKELTKKLGDLQPGAVVRISGRAGLWLRCRHALLSSDCDVVNLETGEMQKYGPLTAVRPVDAHVVVEAG
jgi:hypothetical protein